MWRFKEIISGIQSCFALTSHERLVLLLVLLLFLAGLGLRWLYLSRERSGPFDGIKTEINSSLK